MQGKGAGPVNRVELESQVLCAALRQSSHLKDRVGAFTSVRELSHLFPDLLPPPEKHDDLHESNKANFYSVLGVRPQTSANGVIAAYLRTVRHFLRTQKVADSRVEFNRILNAGFILRKPRLRLSHDLVAVRRWLHEESRLAAIAQQEVTQDRGEALKVMRGELPPPVRAGGVPAAASSEPPAPPKPAPVAGSGVSSSPVSAPPPNPAVQPPVSVPPVPPSVVPSSVPPHMVPTPPAVPAVAVAEHQSSPPVPPLPPLPNVAGSNAGADGFVKHEPKGVEVPPVPPLPVTSQQPPAVPPVPSVVNEYWDKQGSATAVEPPPVPPAPVVPPLPANIAADIAAPPAVRCQEGGAQTLDAPIKAVRPALDAAAEAAAAAQHKAAEEEAARKAAEAEAQAAARRAAEEEAARRAAEAEAQAAAQRAAAEADAQQRAAAEAAAAAASASNADVPGSDDIVEVAPGVFVPASSLNSDAGPAPAAPSPPPPSTVPDAVPSVGGNGAQHAAQEADDFPPAHVRAQQQPMQQQAQPEERAPGRISKEAAFVFDESALAPPPTAQNKKVPVLIQLLEAAQFITPVEVQALLAQMAFAPNIPVEKLILNAGYITPQEMASVKLGESLLQSGKINMAQFQVAIYDERTSGLRMAESLQVRGWLSVEVRNAIDEFHRKRN